MDIIEKYESFHDWYLLGVAADRDKKLLELQLIFDNKMDRVRLLFKGASEWVRIAEGQEVEDGRQCQ